MKNGAVISAMMISYLFSFIGCKAIVNKLVFHPDTTSVVSKEHLPPGVQEVYIETDDKETLHSYLVENSGSKRLLIFFHGNAGNISHRLPDLVKLSKYDINVLGVGYRGYGKSSGSPSEEGIYLDGEAAYKYALETLGFSQGNVFVFGRSIGSAVAVHISQNRDIAGLILVSPLTSGKEHAKAQGFGIFSFVAGDSFDNMSKMSNIKSPLLVIHGTSDNIIPFSMGKDLYRNASGKKRFISIEGAGHNNLTDQQYTDYWEAIFDFLEPGTTG